MKPKTAPVPANQLVPKAAVEGAGLTLEAVVETVKVDVALVVEVLSVTDAGLREHPIFAVDDDMLQERLMVPLKPLLDVAVIVEEADCPDDEMVLLVGLADME